MDEATEDLSAGKEITIVRDKLRGAPYESEQLLCDYYVSAVDVEFHISGFCGSGYAKSLNSIHGLQIPYVHIQMPLGRIRVRYDASS